MTERNAGARVVGSLGYAIRAVVKTDDKQITVRFDASDWFVQSADAEIRELHTGGYSGPQADAIFYLIHDRSKLNPFGKLLNYLKTYRPRGRDNTIIGFEVQANREDVRTWLLKNRPQLAAELFPFKPPAPERVNHAVPVTLPFVRS